MTSTQVGLVLQSEQRFHVHSGAGDDIFQPCAAQNKLVCANQSFVSNPDDALFLGSHAVAPCLGKLCRFQCLT